MSSPYQLTKSTTIFLKRKKEIEPNQTTGLVDFIQILRGPNFGMGRAKIQMREMQRKDGR